MDDFSLDAMTNPALIEKRILDTYEEKVTKGEAVVVDSNNTFMFIVEMFSQLHSDSVRAIMNKFNALYPQRALTPEDLYMHMSDYDYINMFSSPASVTMEIILGKQELIDNAVAIEGITTYRKIVIPENTVFTVGDYAFGLYYPIEIRINNISKAFSVVYDTTIDDKSLNDKNPFIQLSVNTVEYAFQSYKDIDIVALRFPVYQFSKAETLADTTSTTGFRHQLSYSDKFYAIRIYHEVSGLWTEIHQTLSDVIYDPMTVTAKVVVDTENQTCTVIIPQIYFTSGLITSQVKMVLYTTKGALDVDISNIASEQISATFTGTSTATDLSEFARPLDRAQTIQIYPSSTKITGGADGYDFESLRTKVINNTFYTKVIRFAELEAKFKDEGFGVAKYEDSIMNRIFFCTKELTDLNGEAIASGSIPLHLSSTLKNDIASGSVIPTNYRWLRYRASDSSFMILPPALMKYDPDTNTSSLVANDDYPSMQETPEKKAALYNASQYTYQPFHLKVNMSDRYPVAYSYNLMSPSVDRIFFMGNNASYGQTINGYTGSILHNNGGTGGYTLRMSVSLSEDLVSAIENADTIEVGGQTQYAQDIWITDIIAYLKYSKKNETGEDCYAILTPTLAKMGDKYLFELQLDTNYFINTKHCIEFGAVRQLEVQNDGTVKQTSGKISANNLVPISSADWTLTFLIKKDKLKYVASAADIYNDHPAVDIDDNSSEMKNYVAGANAANIGKYALADIGDSFLAISEQQLTLTFGKYVSQVYNDVEVFTGDTTYETYATTRYLGNALDVYLRDASGNLIRYTDGPDGHFALEAQANDWLIADNQSACELIITPTLQANADACTVQDIAILFDASMFSKYGYRSIVIDNKAYAYKASGTTATRILNNNSFINVVIFDPALRKLVQLSSNNIALYAGRDYVIWEPVTERMLVFHVASLPVEDMTSLLGKVLIEKPGIDTGITKKFMPGLMIYDVIQSASGYDIVLEKKALQADHSFSPVKSVNYQITFYASQDEMAAGLDRVSDDGVQQITIAHANNWLSENIPQTLTFKVGDPMIAHNAGDNVLDKNGAPSVIGNRTLEYYIDCIQMDARAFISTTASESDLRIAISKMIGDYAGIVDKYTPELLENTHLYYQPLRSIGNASFSIGNDVIKTYPLQIATEFTLTVKAFVYEDDTLREIISDKILGFVNEQIDEDTLSVTSISKMIMDELADYVDAVAVSGFNTKEDLSGELTSDEKMAAYNTQVLKVVNEDTKLSIRRLVYVDDRKLLNTKRGLTINYIT